MIPSQDHLWLAVQMGPRDGPVTHSMPLALLCPRSVPPGMGKEAGDGTRWEAGGTLRNAWVFLLSAWVWVFVLTVAGEVPVMGAGILGCLWSGWEVAPVPGR